VEEVRRLAAKNLDPALPVMRAHGVPEVLAYLRGEIGLDEAARRAILATYQYTKRQNTWFRHQKLVGDADMHIIHPRIASWTQDLEYLSDHFDNFIKLSG
jgi:tRNA dimethylallyltransferase